jgi:hypothetical protein
MKILCIFGTVTEHKLIMLLEVTAFCRPEEEMNGSSIKQIGLLLGGFSEFIKSLIAKITLNLITAKFNYLRHFNGVIQNN